MPPCTVVHLARQPRLFCVRKILLSPTLRLWPIPATGLARSIHSEWIRSLLLALLLNVPIVRADISAAPAATPLTLTAATTLALKDNPGLAQIQARSKAMAAIPSQVGTLPDPVISFNALNIPIDTFDIGQENMTQMQGGISQAFPFPGKLALREEAASHEAEAALYDVTEARWRLERDVNKGWWALFYLDRALEIITANQALLRQFAEIARTKYEVGEGLQQDVLLAQLELSKLLDKELTFTGARNSTEARLNALLAQAANHTITVPKKVSEALPELLAETELFQLAEEHRALSLHDVNQSRRRNRGWIWRKKGSTPILKSGSIMAGVKIRLMADGVTIFSA